MAVAQTAGRTASNPLTPLLAFLMALPDMFLDACRRVEELFGSGQADAIVEAKLEGTRLEQAVSAKAVGKGLVTIGLVVVVLNEVFSIDSINNSTGPFSGVIDTVESIGTSALTLLAVAFIVLAGAVAMRYMDRF